MARKFTRIEGVQESVNNVNAILANIEKRTMTGLLKAAEYLYDDMQVTPPVVPVSPESVKAREKRGGAYQKHLNDTWFARPFPLVKTKPVVVAGFDSPYAIFVHERVLGAKWGAGTVGIINWTRPNSGPKFLEMALKRNVHKIVNIVALDTAYAIQNAAIKTKTK